MAKLIFEQAWVTPGRTRVSNYHSLLVFVVPWRFDLHDVAQINK